MATGRNNKLVGQTGEYLVAAELSRRRLIATTFTGNVPHYDIIDSNEEGKHVSVQVKASRGPSWQFGDITKFCDISFNEKQQIVGCLKQCPVRRLVVVFVMIDAGIVGFKTDTSSLTEGLINESYLSLDLDKLLNKMEKAADNKEIQPIACSVG